MREYCQYVVIDLETNCALVIGKKYKDFSGMVVNSTFRPFLCFWRKIREYYKLKTVCGKTCVVVYWVGGKAKNDIGSVVLTKGTDVRLRGRRYTNDKLNMRLFVWALHLPLCEFE